MKEELIQETLASDLCYDPNMYTKYSNMGFSLLGLIIEKVLNRPYQKAMEELILHKLKTSHLYPDYSEKLEKQFAEGHSKPFLEKKRLPLKHAATHAMAPATGFCGNAEETSLFFHELLLGQGFLKERMQKELRSLNWPVMNLSDIRYGLGLIFSKSLGMELVGHAGGYPGFSTNTANWEGTDYIISFFLNANDSAPKEGTQSIVQIIKKIKETFTNIELKDAKVAGPFMSNWDNLVFVVTEKKALCFLLNTWNPCEEALLLTTKDDIEYWCEEQGGFVNPGEKITFEKDKTGNIISAKWGSSTFIQEKDFLENFKKIIL